jgi:hypothetical protein
VILERGRDVPLCLQIQTVRATLPSLKRGIFQGVTGQSIQLITPLDLLLDKECMQLCHYISIFLNKVVLKNRYDFLLWFRICCR